MYFFQIILSFNKSSTGWYFTAPSPFSERKRKRSRRDRLHMRFFCKLASNQKYTAFWMFYMDVVDQIFKNALTNTNSKHHFDVQWFIAVPFPLTFWNDAETADQHKEPMIDTKCPTREKFVGQGLGWGCRKRAWPCNGHRSPSTWSLWWRERPWGCANTWGNDDYWGG